MQIDGSLVDHSIRVCGRSCYLSQRDYSPPIVELGAPALNLLAERVPFVDVMVLGWNLTATAVHLSSDR